MYCAFDVETTGFLIPSYPPAHALQGRVAQIAAVLLDDKFKEVASFYTPVVLPEHTIFNEGASKANGLTKEYCKKYGVPIELAILNLDSFFAKSQMQIAHNIEFDRSMITFEEEQCYGKIRLAFTNPFCTMMNMTPICKLPARDKRKGFKWPKLIEAYTHCFNKTFDKSHDSLADVRATVEIFRWLMQHREQVNILPSAIQLPVSEETQEFSQA